MTDKEFYNEINGKLFENGSCTPNQWYFIKLVNENKIAMLEVIYPSRGNIRIRRPIKKMRINEDGQEIWLYDLMKFNNKKELKSEGFQEDIRLDQQEGNEQFKYVKENMTA